MNKLNSIIVTPKINAEAASACCFIFFTFRPLFGSKRKATYDNKLEDAWQTLRDFVGIYDTNIHLYKLRGQGFVVEFVDE